MKTSHRAIKKALKSTSLKPWQRIAIARGERRIQKRQRSARIAVQSALIAVNSAFQIAVISSYPGSSKEQKALRIEEMTINVAQWLSNIHNQI
jgi:ERCC4-type nuclease